MDKIDLTSNRRTYYLDLLYQSRIRLKYALLFVSFFASTLLQAQIGPNCTHINASIGVNDSASILVNELVTNIAAIAAQGDSVDVEIVGSYGQRIYYAPNVGGTFEIMLYACPYIGRQLKVNISITGGGGSCWSYLTFKQGNGPVILGRAKTVYCFDPLVQGGHIHDVPPEAMVPCRGTEDATFVADWITAYPCNADSLGTATNDTAKVILREYESFDKEGRRGAGYDTIYVMRLPQITVDNAFCPEKDTVYCGTGGKLGPYMVAGRAFNYGAADSIERFQAIPFIKTAYNDETGLLEFYPNEFDPKCGVSVHVDAWPVGLSECSSQYKVNVEIKQSCYGTPGLYDMIGRSDVVADFVNTFHPKHWYYTRSTSSAMLTVDTGTMVSVFNGSTSLPNPALKAISSTGATSAFLRSGSTTAYARMCVNIPQDGNFTFAIAGSDGVNAGYRLNGEFIPVGAGFSATLPLEACDEFCFEDRGTAGGITTTITGWAETAVAAPLDSIAPGYWRCEFWVVDLDTLPPVLTCALDQKANENLIHDDTLYIPASSHDCASHSYIPPVFVEDDWSGVKYVKAIIPGIATLVLEPSATVDDLWESHKQVKIPHGNLPTPIYYEAYDSCHNLGYDTCWVKVKDYTKPVAICDKGVTVGLSGKKVWVNAEVFDEGSWDNCEVNLLLARRVDWYESCVDLCDETVWCCTNEHYDTLHCVKLEGDKHVDEVEAHYAKYLEWLCNDYVECGEIIYNAWQYALMKHGTLKCVDHPYEVDDHYFKQLFKECYTGYRNAFGYSRVGGPLGSGTGTINTDYYNDIDETSTVKYCFDEYKQLPNQDTWTPAEIQAEIDLYEQIGGGWSDAVPFDCEDACEEVMVEILVMDYWCNWSKCWTWVKVEDKTPVTFGHEVDESLEITCAAYKKSKYYIGDEPHAVSLEYIVDAAKSGDEDALAALDERFGGYEKVWKDEYGNVPEPTYGYYLDEKCICETIDKQVKEYDEHLGYVWKTISYDSCWNYYDTVHAYNGQVVANCAKAIECHQEVWCEFDHCGQGYIYRKWKFVPGCPPGEGHYDQGHRRDTVTRKQLIWVGNNCELQKGMFYKPEETTVYTCGIEYDDAGNAIGDLSPEVVGQPEYMFDDDCRIVGISHSDKVFKIVGGDEACYKVVRTWYFMDWCYLGGKPDNASYWWLDPEYAGKTIYWEQKIIVQDTLNPVCTFEEELDLVEAAGCAYTLDHKVNVTDACGALSYHYELFEALKDDKKESVATGSGELEGMETSFNVVVEDLTTGSYQLKVRVTDECQNESYCIDYFDIVTGKKPSAICITSLTAELTPWDIDQDGEIDTAVVTVWANEFDRSSAPACDSYDSIYFRIELLDGVDDDTFAEDGDSINIGCDHIGTQTIRLWVIDEKGSYDYCDVILVVQNNMGGCPDIDDTDRGRLLGNIATENGDMIEQVEVTATGENLAANMTTGADGLYDFQIPMGMVTTITPTKDIEHGNGVSTMDLIILQKHIIGMEIMGSPYKLIAADVNKDGFINALDLLEMRRLILGELSTFPTNNSWRFLLKDYEFTTNNPQSELFPERLVISVDQAQMKRDFLGIKIGDLDLDGDPTKRSARSGNQLIFHTEDRELVKGQQLTVPFSVNTATLYEGFQFTIHASSSDVAIVDVIGNDNLEVAKSNFGLKRSGNGIMTASWNADKGEDLRADQVFSLVLEATKNSMLSDVLSIDGKVTPAISFPEDGSPQGVAMNFTSEGIDYKLDLFQNEPNPFAESTAIRFTLPKSAEARLSVYDVTGKRVKEVKGVFSKGLNQVAFEANELSTKGLLYYELEVDGTKLTKKMIIQ